MTGACKSAGAGGAMPGRAAGECAAETEDLKREVTKLIIETLYHERNEARERVVEVTKQRDTWMAANKRHVGQTDVLRANVAELVAALKGASATLRCVDSSMADRVAEADLLDALVARHRQQADAGQDGEG